MKEYNVTAYGVVPDSEKVQTKEIQAVIDRCFHEDGGIVVIPAGKYITGGLVLKSNVTLKLLSGAYLKGTRNREDYFSWKEDPDVVMSEEEITDEIWVSPDLRTDGKVPWVSSPGSSWNNGLIKAYRAENIAVIGEEGSVLDGSDCYDPEGEERYRGPHGMNFWYCRNIVLKGYTIQNTGNWAHNVTHCDNITMDHVTCLAGHDGIHMTVCRNVTVTDCEFYTGDDCIAGIANVNVYVGNCIINSACSAFRFGGTNLYAEKCRIYGPCRYYFRGTLSLEDKMNGGTPHPDGNRTNMLSVFTYYADHSFPIEQEPGNIVFSDCVIENADRFLHYNFSGNETWQRACPLASVTFKNIKAKGIGMPLTAWGDAALPFTLVFKNSEIEFREGCENVHFIQCCHVERIVLSGLKIRGCSCDPFVLSWEKDPNVTMTDVDTEKETVIRYTEEKFVCQAI